MGKSKISEIVHSVYVSENIGGERKLAEEEWPTLTPMEMLNWESQNISQINDIAKTHHSLTWRSNTQNANLVLALTHTIVLF